MRFVPVSCEDREAMLRVAGVDTADGLFDVIPDEVRLSRPLRVPEGMGEIELAAHIEELAAANDAGLVSFLGAGCYDHYAPAIVDAVVSKPAFFTAYTPYQPEVSQGTLQAIYEYQSMICELTGMDVSNASMYDGATAFVEAALMAARLTKRDRVVVSSAAHPEWIEVLRTYGLADTIEIVACPAQAGRTDLARLAELSDGAAAVLVASPSFFGTLEDLQAIAEVAHAAGALVVASVNPLLLGALESPAAYGADIVVGEGQPLGNAQSFGGPGFGFLACKTEFIRQMPGRVIGRTVDVDGRPGFVLTMQTREQHIRREKATSNICSNHSLNALAAAVYLSAVGQQGLHQIALACITKAHYLRDALVATARFERLDDAPFAHEFALRYHGDVAAMQSTLLDRGYLEGLDLGRFGEAYAGIVLFAVTEKRTREQMDAFVEEVAAL